MDQIIPGLWIGDLACALATDYLVASGTTHIVTALKQALPTPIRLPDGRSIDAAHVYHVNIDDIPEAPIMVHFPGVIEFIDEALHQEWLEDGSGGGDDDDDDDDDDKTAMTAQRDKEIASNSRCTPPPGKRPGQWATMGEGTVLVHCHAGISRSVAIVVAYLMHTRKITVARALAIVQSRRSIADPNAGFMHQLELYESAGWSVDVRNQRIRRFLMSQASILRGDPIDDVLLSYYPSPFHSPASSSSGCGPGASLQFSTLEDGGEPASANHRSSESHSPTTTSSGRNSAAMSRQNSRVAVSSAAAKGAHERHHQQRRATSPQQRRVSTTSSPQISPTSLNLSKSPPMPDRSRDLFDEDDDGASSSARSSNVHKIIRETFTSVDEPHEVMITVNAGNLPGGVSKVRGNQSQQSQRAAARNGERIASSSGATQPLKAGRAPASQRLPRPNFGAMKLRCKMCRRELAAQDHVVEHEPGKGKDAFDVRKRAKDAEQKSRDGRAALGGGDENMTLESRFGAQRRAKEEEERVGPGADAENVSGADAANPAGVDEATTTETAAKAEEKESAAPPSTYKSAASLSAQLPPHLAALRLSGRAQPNVNSTVATPTSPSQSSRVNGHGHNTATSTDLRKMLHSPVCSAYFVEPLAWMSALQLGEVAGRLDCPSTRCGAKLGSWDWAGMQCACGAWVTPAFALHRSKVDEV